MKYTAQINPIIDLPTALCTKLGKRVKKAAKRLHHNCLHI